MLSGSSHHYKYSLVVGVGTNFFLKLPPPGAQEISWILRLANGGRHLLTGGAPFLVDHCLSQADFLCNATAEYAVLAAYFPTLGSLTASSSVGVAVQDCAGDDLAAVTVPDRSVARACVPKTGVSGGFKVNVTGTTDGGLRWLVSEADAVEAGGKVTIGGPVGTHEGTISVDLCGKDTCSDPRNGNGRSVLTGSLKFPFVLSA